MIVKVASSNGWKMYEAYEVSWMHTEPVGVEGADKIEFIEIERPTIAGGEPQHSIVKTMIDMQTVKGRVVVFTEGEAFVLNDSGKTIDRIY